MIDISTYLHRINYRGSIKPTIETLRALHRAHLLTVPFENLDIHRNQPIVLDEAALFEKIVVNRRGGFCYELNGLLASLLRDMGFDVTMFSSNVIHGGISAEIDHLTLLIQLDERWIVDVGFGDSSRLPLRLVEEEKQFGVDSTYRFVCSNNRWFLQRLIETDEWYDEYSFDVNLIPLAISDFEEANRYYQTAPESYFVQGRICSRAMEEGRISLTGHELIVTRNGQKEETPIEDEQTFVRALNEHFGIRII
ncbi:MAG: arylamine N-acetyltransferase [Chloroflexi bacterium]|nr:arylamine N-acetyltransferase [Chloroflexota bacterium]